MFTQGGRVWNAVSWRRCVCGLLSSTFGYHHKSVMPSPQKSSTWLQICFGLVDGAAGQSCRKLGSKSGSCLNDQDPAL
jgi:hypothetical protein